jgi:hypothetical protein
MKPRLYLETTIPSYLTARPSRDLRLAADQESTAEWWETKRREYELFTSAEVIDEVAEGDAAMADARLKTLEGIALLPATDAAVELAEHLLRAGITPPNAASDALHIGISAAHAMDFLLTWNCKHINNPPSLPAH